ncbi:chaperonin 10-like protein [Exophiala viscosa]|uniref:Chaperonin 10-like protein n=1 Tax=Exophiala viscosa TaxID=2486360 RepID=A0AAN6DRB7_9EURO|nr:chaperonin 10-like protein [Exophiala viscosa]KAI1620585.1 chaperonin 10-like protein [Exophiala viscosa]
MAESFCMRGVDGKVKQLPADVPDLKPKEVLVKITHSGLCGTDVFYIPHGAALGHEGVGIVEKVGDAVTAHKVGDRVGGGYLRSSCGTCKYCLTGNDIMCYNRDIYGHSNFSNGTFSTYYTATESYIYPIPESMPSEIAAPLQCAGATVYSALKTHYQSGMRVGVLGIGGLGHLAIQFASKMGASTVVFSTSPDKEAEARNFGASEFVVLGQEDKLSAPVDVLLITAHKAPDWNTFMSEKVVSRGAAIVVLGAVGTSLEVPFLPYFFNCYNLVTNLVASRATHGGMLAFAAAHDIKPLIEEFKMDEDGFAEALDKLQTGKIRYRAVLHV